MKSLWQDLRYGARTLLKQPGFALIAIITLALGIGANTAVFGIVNVILWRPLPGIQAPAQLVAFERTEKGELQPLGGSFSYPAFSDYQQQTKTFSGLLAFCSAALDLSNGGETERVQGLA